MRDTATGTPGGMGFKDTNLRPATLHALERASSPILATRVRPANLYAHVR